MAVYTATETCFSTGWETETMKVPNPATEAFEFNVGRAPEVSCRHRQKKGATCGECEACLLNKKLIETSSWFPRAGDQSRRRFSLGLVRRLHSVDLLRNVLRLLEPLLRKDFTYARSRLHPSISTDSCTMSCDRALDVVDLEKKIAETWCWFQAANYWTKSNYLLSLFSRCEAHLLYATGLQAKTLLVSEQNAFIPRDDLYEAESVASSSYTYDTGEHPELDLLTTAASDYSYVKHNPLSEAGTATDIADVKSLDRDISHFTRDIITTADSGHESLDESDSDFDSIDPTCMVIPSSSKAHSGVAKYRDFVRDLPVHLSKSILGLLDQRSLVNCLCVSLHWRKLTEEAQNEYYVNQHLWEEVMLMQGAGAQGVSPHYGKDVDVAVPNLHPESWQAIRTDESVVDTAFKSEVSFRTAYSGYSTRNIIMEERNVYCGAYNVMVLLEDTDHTRVIDTNNGKLITMGSMDRKVCFINGHTGRHEEPVVTGHAGSVRCVALNECKGYVLSGSYDTSIRSWSLETGKCQKIYRGHTDTVLCMQIVGDQLVSGGKDRRCKVWDLEKGKVLRTFKHRHPVTAVALSEDLCISACEAGRVKVWDLKSGHLIKRLSGHHGPVTGVKFDQWHIVTSSKDGYVLAWSAQGDHSRCLTALRHPKEVLCLELMYLRIISGAADGKVRIWNMVTGQCLRIMRGNSRSDPVTQLVAIGNRVTINTPTNVLVMNFEPVEYDYTMEHDKTAPMVQYSRYQDAPVRPQTYPYVRAQRMRSAGATNPKIVTRSGKEQPQVYYRYQQRAQQTPHSAKSLSLQTMERAKRIQSAGARLETTSRAVSAKTGAAPGSRQAQQRTTTQSAVSGKKHRVAVPSVKSVSLSGKGATQSKVTKSRGLSGTQSIASVGFHVGRAGDGGDSSDSDGEDHDRQRRISWAFQHPMEGPSHDLDLVQMKSLLRSQIRAKGDVVPPDFIYMTINNIQASMKRAELTRDMEMNRREEELISNKRFGRPSSSPSRLDPRTKVALEELALEQLLAQQQQQQQQGAVDADAKSEAGSRVSGTAARSTRGRPPATTTIVTQYAARPVDTRPHLSMHSNKTKSSIPQARLLRPHTATVRTATAGEATGGPTRPCSAVICQPTSASRRHRYSSSAIIESSAVPMKMLPADLPQRLEQLKLRTTQRLEQANQVQRDAEGKPIGRVTECNDPMRTHVDFRLLTHEQVGQQMANIMDTYTEDKEKKKRVKDRQQQAAWLARVKGQTSTDFARRPRAMAPEIGEYGEYQSVS